LFRFFRRRRSLLTWPRPTYVRILLARVEIQNSVVVVGVVVVVVIKTTKDVSFENTRQSSKITN